MMMREYKITISLNSMIIESRRIDKPEITIGRGSENDIVIDNAGVSRHHATIFADVNSIMIADANSSNGTYVNDFRITEKQLDVGDEIIIGKHLLKLRKPEEDDLQIDTVFQSKSQNSDFQNETFLVDEYGRQQILENIKSDKKLNTPTVVISNNRQIHFKNDCLTIGKRRGINVRVKGIFVKDLQANIIKLNPKTYKIISYGNFLSPTKVNGSKIREKILRNGDVIQVGRTWMVYNN